MSEGWKGRSEFTIDIANWNEVGVDDSEADVLATLYGIRVVWKYFMAGVIQ